MLCAEDCEVEDYSKPFDWNDCPIPEWVSDGDKVYRYCLMLDLEFEKSYGIPRNFLYQFSGIPRKKKIEPVNEKPNLRRSLRKRKILERYN